jgi:Zn-dependent M28 family amino/carboxypeptidase
VVICLSDTMRYSVRAVVNLEAMGTTKPPMLFQATSEEMIQAYSKVPHPFGTIIAADVFGSGVMLSEYVHIRNRCSAEGM